MPVWMSFALFGAGVALSRARVRSAQARRLMKGAETPLTPLESLRVGSLTQKIKVYVSRGRHECGSRASEALAGVADRVREQQSPERACARERGRAWFCVAKRPDEVGVATD